MSGIGVRDQGLDVRENWAYRQSFILHFAVPIGSGKNGFCMPAGWVMCAMGVEGLKVSG